MTEDTHRLPPAGWYPDPEGSRSLRWWNGNQWERHALAPGTRLFKPIGRAFERWSQLLGVLLAFNLIIGVAEVALYVWGLSSAIDAVGAGDIDTADTYDNLNIALTVLDLVSVLVAGIVWVVWQYQLARATEGLDRSPAMHGWSWVIPIGNLWLPFQNVRDLWRRILPLRDTLVLGWWWAGWIATSVIARLFLRGDEIDSVDDLRSEMWTFLVLSVLGVVTVVLALHVVRSLSRAAWTAEVVRKAGSPDAW